MIDKLISYKWDAYTQHACISKGRTILGPWYTTQYIVIMGKENMIKICPTEIQINQKIKQVQSWDGQKSRDLAYIHKEEEEHAQHGFAAVIPVKALPHKCDSTTVHG